MLVPAFAGSTPARTSANGNPVPSTTEVMTMRSSDTEMAAALATSPWVTYTRRKPPADRPVPRSRPTSAWSHRVARALAQLGRMAPVAYGVQSGVVGVRMGVG